MGTIGRRMTPVPESRTWRLMGGLRLAEAGLPAGAGGSAALYNLGTRPATRRRPPPAFIGTGRPPRTPPAAAARLPCPA
jgi:hypothetical protein